MRSKVSYFAGVASFRRDGFRCGFHCARFIAIGVFS